jgi:flagellar M-ring protein FliF
VHVTFAKESVFAEQRQPAKASVLVKLRTGATLPPPKVSAICHLTASAVEGLDPGAVSVVDMRGNLLNRPKRTLGAEGGDAPDGMIEFRQQVERDLMMKVNGTLEPLLGPEKYRAGVFVDCDFTSGEQSEETFDPTKSVMTNSQRTEDVSGANAASGQPGTASNLPRPTSRPGASSGGVSRRTENIAYQASRVVKRLRLPQGGIKRVSAAVLVDHVVRWEGEGAKARRIVEPVPPEKMKVIRDLVTAAIGLTPARGDQLTVECLPFESTLTWTPPAPSPAAPAPGIPGLPPWLQQLLGRKDAIVWVASGAGAALLLVLVAAFFLIRRLKRKPAAPTAQTALPAPRPAAEVAAAEEEDLRKQMEAKLAEQAALKEKLTAEALNSLKLPQITTKKAEVLAKHITEEAKKDPAAVAHLIRTWLNEAES